jgi:3-deoxy-D-manno-octulosonic acid kinase
LLLSPLTSPPQPGYQRLDTPIASGVALAELVQPLREIVSARSIYAHAAAHPERRELSGRGPAYAIPLGPGRVVVRHVRHGGLLAPLTRDLFLAPTRAPYELAVSHRLRDGGVPTPQIVAYVTYPAAMFLRRADVITREIPDATDLGSLLGTASRSAADRAALWEAVSELVAALAAVGAYHADLNVKNVLISTAADGRHTAHAIDVDRVVWGHPGDPALVRTNLDRLHRSARKQGLL